MKDNGTIANVDDLPTGADDINSDRRYPLTVTLADFGYADEDNDITGVKITTLESAGSEVRWCGCY